MKVSCFAILIYLFLTSNSFAQNEKYKEYNVSLPVIEVIDSNFYYVLDYVLDLDTNCDYFSDSLWYSIWVGECFSVDEKHITFQFSGNLKKSLYLECVDYYVGVLKYGTHYFFIYGKVLSEDIFKITNNRCFIHNYFEKYDMSYDDSWATHIMAYRNGEYYFIETFNDKIRCK
ncbi:MAG: hypothetical protein ACOXZH_05440 [Bacteroidales bacterium]